MKSMLNHTGGARYRGMEISTGITTKIRGYIGYFMKCPFKRFFDKICFVQFFDRSGCIHRCPAQPLNSLSAGLIGTPLLFKRP